MGTQQNIEFEDTKWYALNKEASEIDGDLRNLVIDILDRGRVNADDTPLYDHTDRPISLHIDLAAWDRIAIESVCEVLCERDHNIEVQDSTATAEEARAWFAERGVQG